jgi:D-alanyl-D-alanine dipeptidase
VLRLDGVNRRLARAVRAAARQTTKAHPGWKIVVTSGYRSPRTQAALRARWDRGDRRGLSSRPALDSAHTRGEAVDLAFAYRGVTYRVADTPRSAFAYLAKIMEPYGVRWGGSWSEPSPNHYELA